jgi:thiamine-monophosphate kinase
VGASVIGGDVARARDGIAIDVIALGRVEHAVLRNGAAPGDELWVTGELGGAAAAVAAWRAGRAPDRAARRAYALPAPRTAEAVWLRERGLLRAAIDLSDGLASDAGHIAAASGVGIELDETRVPIHPAALAAESEGGDAFRLALGGGEDYELLFAAPAGAVEPLVAEFMRTFRVRLTRVGVVTRGTGVRLRQHEGTVAPLAIRGFDHFSEDAS